LLTADSFPDWQVRDLVTVDAVTGADSLATIRLTLPARGEATNPLLWFPNVVNRWINQGTGILTVALCILGIIYRTHRWGWWITAFLLLDFSSRFAFGGAASLLSQIASLLVAPFENSTKLRPEFKPGPPKQFAASCGIAFTATATALYFNGYYIVGAIILGLLSGAAGLEGFIDFCVGCFFFGYALKFKMVPTYVYAIATNTLEETKLAWEYMFLPSGAPAPVKAGDESSALRYKIKSAEWTKDDYSIIRNMQAAYFAIPMGIGGLAVAFKIASPWTHSWARIAAYMPKHMVFAQPEWWQVFGVAAAVAYCLLLLLFIARLALFPRKVAKEWACPWRSNAFALLPACLFLFSFLIYDVPGVRNAKRALSFARVMWWIGGVTNMGMTVSKLAEWTSRSLSYEHVNPGWMLIPACNLLAALVAPVLPLIPDHVNFSSPLFARSSATLEVAGFFFAIGAFLWIVLYTITLYGVATSHNTSESQRAFAYVWITPPTVGGLAYLAINMGRAVDNVAVVATFAQSYYLSIVLFLGLTYAWAPYRQFFGANKFDVSYWAMTFPLDAIAASAAMYYQLSAFPIALVLMVLFLALAALANGLCLLHTFSAIVKRRGIFTPDEKFGPLSFMKLTHEAFRGFLPKLSATLDAMHANDPASVKLFCALYSQFAVLHHEHSHHEDDVVYRHFNDMFPGHADKWVHDHEADRLSMERWEATLNGMLGDLGGAGVAAAIDSLKAELKPFLSHFLDHLQGEEDHLNAIGRKYVPLAVQKELVARCFAATPAASWERIFPFVVEHCPRFAQRTRFVQCFTWALPERAQQIGAILHRNVDAVTWERLAVVLPNIIPRGVANHTKLF
jgi:tellurite resistance protein